MPTLLTDIARQLKETFDGFNVAEIPELQQFRELYGEAEAIRIGEMDYIVINQPYRSEEYSDLPEGVSPLFYNSIRKNFAIIDTETSSTLIDEVYSRVTYMQRVCKVVVAADKDQIKKSFDGLVGAEQEMGDVHIESEGAEHNEANIFQCQLVKDTGVSASPDVYSFMYKNGQVKEIAYNVMRQIRKTGEVSLLKDRDVVEKHSSDIQEAVFNKYFNSDMDIQNITVKSIFEIKLNFMNIHLELMDEIKRKGIFNTSYLASENNEFEMLNANIHTCNACGHELVDVHDSSKISKLHLNTDALDPVFTKDGDPRYAVGCENCLVECPECHGWHFNYEKFITAKDFYKKVKLAPGRAFIENLRSVEGNYCSCRKGIEWIYDERSGSGNEHDIIPIRDLAVVNFANEMIATYDDYKLFFERKTGLDLTVENSKETQADGQKKERRRDKKKSGVEKEKLASKALIEFRQYLANRFNVDVTDLKITNVKHCQRCSVCNGDYYYGALGMEQGFSFRCNVCEEMVTERHRMVTRTDGIIFMRCTLKNKNTINKYVVTKAGNLRKLSSSVIELEADAGKKKKYKKGKNSAELASETIIGEQEEHSDES